MNDTILLADDDEGVAALVRRTLAEEGCRVTSVRDGSSALDAVSAEPPALILLDVRMPGLDGWRVLGELRSRPATRLTPVIMLTGMDDDADKDRGFTLGADDYVTKPFSPRELKARVLGHLRRHREALATHPLTGLPGSPSARAEVEARLASGEPFSLIHADIDRFKAYNDAYGYERGDRAIMALAQALEKALREAGEARGFIGHIGGDDFVVVCSEEKAELAAAFAVMIFDELVPALHEERDARRGWLETRDREGRLRRHALMSLTLGGVHASRTRPTCYADAVRAADEMKGWLKTARTTGPSLWAFDRRSGGTGATPPGRA